MNYRKFLIEVIGTVVGASIMAASVSFFLLPNGLSSGGFSGIATILYYTLNFPVGITIVTLNAPLFIFSGFKIGKTFFMKSLIGTLCLSAFIDIFDKFGAITDDKILACVYGGLLTGLGTALILKSGSSTGGSDLVSILIKQYNKKFEMGRTIVIIDIIIVILNVVFLKNIEIGLYSAITIYIMGLMVDIVFEGIFFTKLMIIISDKSETIAKEIQTKAGRGVTGLFGKGMYTNDVKTVVLCAVGRRDIAKVKSIITHVDKDAFVIVTNSREVLGSGFKST